FPVVPITQTPLANFIANLSSAPVTEAAAPTATQFNYVESSPSPLHTLRFSGVWTNTALSSAADPYTLPRGLFAQTAAQGGNLYFIARATSAAHDELYRLTPALAVSRLSFTSAGLSGKLTPLGSDVYFVARHDT